MGSCQVIQASHRMSPPNCFVDARQQHFKFISGNGASKTRDQKSNPQIPPPPQKKQPPERPTLTFTTKNWRFPTSRSRTSVSSFWLAGLPT